MTRHYRIPLDQTTESGEPSLPTLIPAGNSNPVVEDFNPESPYIPTQEEKETMTMSDETMPIIDTSIFSDETPEGEPNEWEAVTREPKQTSSAEELKKMVEDARQRAQFNPVSQSSKVESEVAPSATSPAPSKKNTKFHSLIEYTKDSEGQPRYRGPIAAGQFLLGEDENQGLVNVKGDAQSYVYHNNMYLHGAIMQMGSSASNAQETEGYDPALGVTGFLPQAIEFIQKSARAARAIEATDRDNRPHQFGVITILGGSDHDKLTNSMKSDPSQGLIEALAQLGLAKVRPGYYVNKKLNFVDFNIQIKPVLFNNLGYITAFEIRFSDIDTYGEGKHYIYLHRANDIGGGKSDHSLSEGRTQSQAKALSDEFDWWKAALTICGGKIGAIETTLGGTARVGRYALLHAKVPRPIFSADAVETILLDDGAWVKNNLGNMLQEYRANFATTLLRTAYGSLSNRLTNVRVNLANRHDPIQRRLRQTTCIETVLRSLFPGVTQLAPMFMDISDERTAIASQEDITDAKQFVIHDPVENKPKGPWALNRRTRVTSAASFSYGELFSTALGQRNSEAIERAKEMFEQIRGLATSVDTALNAGGFCILDIFVPKEALESAEKITTNMVQQVAQVFANAYHQAGSDKILVHCHQVPEFLLPNKGLVYVQLTEDQPAHNMLLVSTHDGDARKKRTITMDPNLDIIEAPHYAHVNGFARLFQQLIEGHEKSNYRFAEDDAHLLRAFYRHFFSNVFGNQPNLILGGSNRPLKK